MKDRYLVAISESWDGDIDKPRWCAEAYPEEAEDTSLGYAYSYNSAAEAIYDLFNGLERG